MNVFTCEKERESVNVLRENEGVYGFERFQVWNPIGSELESNWIRIGVQLAPSWNPIDSEREFNWVFSQIKGFAMEKEIPRENGRQRKKEENLLEGEIEKFRNIKQDFWKT